MSLFSVPGSGVRIGRFVFGLVLLFVCVCFLCSSVPLAFWFLVALLFFGGGGGLVFMLVVHLFVDLCRFFSCFWCHGFGGGGWGGWSLCLSCICLLICVVFSLPSGVKGWLRLLLVVLPGLFCLPFRIGLQFPDLQDTLEAKVSVPVPVPAPPTYPPPSLRSRLVP